MLFFIFFITGITIAYNKRYNKQKYNKFYIDSINPILNNLDGIESKIEDDVLISVEEKK